MTARYSRFAAVAAVIAVAACQTTTSGTGGTGGTGSTQTTYGKATTTSPYTSAGNSASITYNSAGFDTLTQDSKTFGIKPISGQSNSFQIFKASSSEEYALRIPTTSAAGELMLTRDLMQMLRTADTTIPNTGNATYTGSYTGFWGTRDDPVTTFVVFGDVSLLWALANGEISGSITNRQSQSGSTSLDDVLLSGTVDNDGIVTGTTKGGATSTSNAIDGAFHALAVGADGEEIIGEVFIPSFILSGSGSTISYSEIGAFLAKADP